MANELNSEHQRRLQELSNQYGKNKRAEAIAKIQEEVEHLLSLGADPFVDDKNSAFNNAVTNIPILAERYLGDARPEQLNKEHVLCLAWNRRPDLLRSALKLRPDLIHARQDDDFNLIHAATKYFPDPRADDTEQTVNIILDTDPQAVHSVWQGNKPIHVASGESNRHVTHKIIIFGGNINELNGEGDRPVHIAALLDNRAEANLALLINKGADLSLPNAAGETVSDVAWRASKSRSSAALNILKAHGLLQPEKAATAATAIRIGNRDAQGTRSR